MAAQERTELLASNKLEMDNLFEKRSQIEHNFMEATQERAEQYFKVRVGPLLPPSLLLANYM